ncbi:glycosyltransferase family 1 protein [Silanimonas sp.]|uniref:glycosyltransferase family 4 protein n=1 Tax=Silanimonas sp. TaxID=1929290 RepID=UPI001BB9119A|nr:glycosyltransferase family 1 protein [Silanimonas sp.]MBS3895758.1 glycosyltransferase family 1 protein [Silanimonas sp.]MBS3924732.1 glycosyltransferase family 1 protein [Xanthomonadaceae bacterium]
MVATRRYELITETYPPEINGVALTVQSLHEGLMQLGHAVGLVRPTQAGESAGGDDALLRVSGVPLPRYPGLRFGLPAGGVLAARWHRQRPDAVYIATEGPLGWSALRTARRLGIPAATGFHTRFDDYVGRYGAGFLSPWVFAWLRRFHNHGQATLVPTGELIDELSRQGFHRVVQLGRAVDTHRFHPARRSEALRLQWGVEANGPVLIHVGRIAPEKNIPLLLRAYDALKAECPSARLVMVGDGPERAALADSRPDLHFTGMLRGETLATHFASADLFIFPSLSETFGNVTLEAMASGLATVAFDYGAAREHLVDGLHGARVVFGDEARFVDRVLDTALRPDLATLGAAARRAVEALSPDAVARDFATLLAGLAADPTRRAA